MEHVPAPSPETQFATFQVHGLFFGVELRHVQELIRMQHMTPVPLAPGPVRGLINLRGQIVVAVDARSALGLPERPPGEEPMNVVLRSEDGGTSLLVDSIGDVISVPERARVSPTENMPAALRENVLSVFQLPATLLLVPDIARLLA